MLIFEYYFINNNLTSGIRAILIDLVSRTIDSILFKILCSYDLIMEFLKFDC